MNNFKIFALRTVSIALFTISYACYFCQAVLEAGRYARRLWDLHQINSKIADRAALIKEAAIAAQTGYVEAELPGLAVMAARFAGRACRGLTDRVVDGFGYLFAVDAEAVFLG
jgi:hypothetical protein